MPEPTTFTRIALIATGVLLTLTVSLWIYTEYVANPRVARQLQDDPDGERAKKVMLLTLPSGRRIPVNYLREDGRVFAGADGRWWRELADDGSAVSLFMRGEEFTGRATAMRDDRAYTERIFAKLRPNAIRGFGTLVEIELDGDR